ncbi:TIGR03086 family metal-binding protein [Nakamurella aerolata]|uniref:TIGR03086 family protein n=1 Tax=Nakamurella aerolata TaxID=1656892 RepID=A0A849A514_9ACTN|nr:TIGR03086 family metal-binding protein [Nakamurella aerolata]NNG35157.1 TIGR03086 family protein [Nakamurella aerolata]
MTATSTPPPTAAQLHPVLEDLAALLDNVSEEQWNAPTPCSDFTVAQLRDHVVQWSSAFAGGLADPDGRTPDADSIAVAGDGADQLRSNADKISDAVDDGAADRPLFIGDESLPGDMSLAMILWEYQVHGWDLAVATGQPWSPDEAGVRASLAFAPGMLTPDFQGEGKSFGPRVAVPADAAAIDHLVGLSGRDPQWRP